MEGQNGTDRNNLIAKRENFEAFISPRTFQKLKSKKRIIKGPKLASSQNYNSNGSTDQNSEEESLVMKVSVREYDLLKKKYSENKKYVRQKNEESQSSQSRSKSPSSLKPSAKLEDGSKREKSTSPRPSGAASKQNGKSSHTEKTASKNNHKPESKRVWRRSYDVADVKTKTETVGKSRWSAGIVSSRHVDNDKIVNAFSLNLKVKESPSVNVSDSPLEKNVRQKTSRIPKSPNKLQANDHKKDNVNKRNGFVKENKNKTSKCPISKEHNTSDKETSKGKNGNHQNTRTHNRINADEMSINTNIKDLEQKKLDNNCSEIASNQMKQNKKADITQKDQDSTNKLCGTPQNSVPSSNQKGNPIVVEEDKNIMPNDCLKKLESQEGVDVKLDDLVGAAVCEDRKGMTSLNRKISTDETQKSQDLLETIVPREVDIIERVMDCPFITKRTDKDSAPDALQPSVDLDESLNILLQDNNMSKCDDAGLTTDPSDNNVLSMQYDAVPGTSKTVDINLDQDANNQQCGPLTVALKLAKKHPPAARTPIILKTPKRLKDGEIMSEMLIYKLGSHSTPRKIRKNRNLDSLRKSDWGTPATDRITSAFLKRTISKKIKGKMFIKKASKGILHPLPTSTLVPKREPLDKSTGADSDYETNKVTPVSGLIRKFETYKVTPVSVLIRKFENLEKEEECATSQSKVDVTFNKNAISENGAKNILQGLQVLKEVKKISDTEVQDKETNELSKETLKLKANSTNRNETIPSNNCNLINNGNFNNLTISNGANTDSIDGMSFISLKFDEIFSDECADQTEKNMRFSDLYREINLQLSDSESNEANEDKTYRISNEEGKNSGKNNLESAANSISQDNDNLPVDKLSIILTNNHGQEEILIEDGNKVFKNLEDNNSVDGNTCESGKLTETFTEQLILNESYQEDKSQNSTSKEIAESRNPSIRNEQMKDVSEVVDDVFTADEAMECQEDNKLENSTQQPTNQVVVHPNQPDGFRGFEDVIIAEGRIDTTGEDRASPAYEAGVDEIKEEDFGEIYREKLLSLKAPEDDDDTSISTLLALSQKLSKQPTSYAEYRKQFMEVKSRSLPPQKINRCETDSKMSL